MPQNPRQNGDPEIDRILSGYVKDKVREEATRQGVPADFADRMANTESAYKPNVIKGQRRSPAGAIGAMQVMPGTAKDLKIDPYNVNQNIEGGVRYAGEQLRAFGNDQRKASAAYNWGPGNVRKYGVERAPAETQNYMRKVAGQSQQADPEIENLLKQYQQEKGAQQQPDYQTRTYPKQYIGSETDPAKQKADKANWSRQFSTNFDINEVGPGSTTDNPPKIVPVPRAPQQPSTTTPNVFNKTLAQDQRAATGDARAALDFRNASTLNDATRLTAKVISSPAAARRRQIADEYQKKSALGQRAADLGQTWESFKTGAADTVLGAAEVVGSAAGGDFRPLSEAARGVAGAITDAQRLMQQAASDRQARRAQDPLFQRIERERQEQQLQREATPQMASRITRGFGDAALGLPAMVGAAEFGGIPALTALTAAQQDFARDPQGAIVNTATAGVPIAVGRAISPMAGRLAGRVASALQRPVQIGTEVIAGGAANVGQYAATQAALGREIDPEEALTQGITGAVLSGAMAPKLADVQARNAARDAMASRNAIRRTIDQRSAANVQDATAKGRTEPLTEPLTSTPQVAPTAPVAPAADAAPAAAGMPNRADFEPGFVGDVEYQAALLDAQRAPKAAKAGAKAAAVAKPAYDPAAFRGAIDDAKIQAGEAEAAGNWEAARDQYRSAMDTITEMQKEARKNRDAAALSELAREKSATNTNWQMAKRNAERAAKQPAPKAPEATRRMPQVQQAQRIADGAEIGPDDQWFASLPQKRRDILEAHWQGQTPAQIQRSVKGAGYGEINSTINEYNQRGKSSSTLNQNPQNSIESVAPTRDLSAPLPASVEASPRTTPPAPVKERGLRRNYRAGMNNAAVEFTDGVQRDLFDLAAKEKYSMGGGQNKTYNRPVGDIAGLRESLRQRLGVDDSELSRLAGEVRDDVRAQMKGVKDGETRRLVNNVKRQEAPPSVDAARTPSPKNQAKMPPDVEVPREITNPNIKFPANVESQNFKNQNEILTPQTNRITEGAGDALPRRPLTPTEQALKSIRESSLPAAMRDQYEYLLTNNVASPEEALQQVRKYETQLRESDAKRQQMAKNEKARQEKQAWQMPQKEYLATAPYLHGTNKQSAEQVKAEGKLKPGQKQNYSDPEFGDRTYFARPDSHFFTDDFSKDWIDLSERLPLEVSPDAKVLTWKSRDDIEKTAREIGYSSAEDFVSDLQNGDTSSRVIDALRQKGYDVVEINNPDDPYGSGAINWRPDPKYAEIGFTGQQLIALNPDAIELSSVAHRNAVERALTEGKPVPPEVLADYPDLAPKPLEKTAPQYSPADRLARLRAAAQQAPPMELAQPERPAEAPPVNDRLERLKRIANQVNQQFAQPEQPAPQPEAPKAQPEPVVAVKRPPAPSGEPKLSNRVVKQSLQEEMGATSTNRSDKLRLSGPSENYREVVTKWDDAPEGTVFKKPEHYGDETNVLFDRRLEDRKTTNGENATFFIEAQSDWHQSKDAPPAPLKNTWLRRALDDTAREASEAGQDGVLLPKTVEQLYEIQRWGAVKEKDGRYTNSEGFDITPVVRRYLKELPDLAKKAANKNGVELQTRTVDDGRGGQQELWFLPVRKSAADKTPPRAVSSPAEPISAADDVDFVALAEQSAAQRAAKAEKPQRRKMTGELSPIEYLKRKTNKQGFRVSDKGEARRLGSKESGIVGLTNKRSKFSTHDAQVMLDEGGFAMPDGRAFTDPSVTETDVMSYLENFGKQKRQGTAGLDQRLADEETEYYRQQEEQEAAPRSDVERRRLIREGAPKGEFGKLSEYARTRATEDRALAGSDELRDLLGLPEMPPYLNEETGKTVEWSKAAQETMDALAEMAGFDRQRSSQMGLEGLRDAWKGLQAKAKSLGASISADLKDRFIHTAKTYQVAFLEPYKRLHESNEVVDNALRQIEEIYEQKRPLTTEENRQLYRTLRDEFVKEGLTENYFRKTYWPSIKEVAGAYSGEVRQARRAGNQRDVQVDESTGGSADRSAEGGGRAAVRPAKSTEQRIRAAAKRAGFGPLENEPSGPVNTMFGGQKILDSLRTGRRKIPPKTIPADFNAQGWIRKAAENLAAQTLSDADKAKIADPKTTAAEKAKIYAAAKIDPAQQNAFQTAMDEAFAALSANDYNGFQDAANRLKAISDAPATDWEKASAVRKAAMLSRPVSHLRNILGSVTFKGMEGGARIPGSGADVLLGLITNRRTLQGINFEDGAQSIYAAATDGITAAKDAMAGRSNEEIAKALQTREVNFNNKVVDKAVKFVFRSLGAEDQIFYTGAYDRAIRESAKLQARNEARQGIIKRTDIKARQDALLAAPTPQMEIDAALAAETAVFRNDNALSSAISRVREGASDKANFALDLVLPFDRTPTNVVLRALEYSPLGVARGAVKGVAGSARTIAARRAAKKAGAPSKADVQAAIDKAFTPAQQRSAAQLLGRGTVGSGLLALGYALAAKGLMTGFYDDEDYKGEAMKRATGAQPLAIQIGGRWYGLNGVGPIGMALGLGATLHDEGKKKDGTPVQSSYRAIKEQILETPSLSSLKDLSKDEERMDKDVSSGGKIAGNVLASFIPGIVGDVAQSIPYVRDPFEREVKDDPKKVKGWRRAVREGAGQVGAKIPGVRRMLPVKKDITGKPIPSRPLAPIDPFSSRPATGPLPRRR